MKKGDVTLAATLFVLIGEETASEVLRYLNEAEIEAISREISNVGPLQHTDAEKSAEELYQTLVANRFVSEGGVDYAKKVILRTLGAGQAKRILERLSSSYNSANAFEAIDRLNPIQLSQFIQNEHPQTIALILAHLTPSSSAELLESLPEDIQADVAVRMSNIETIAPDVIRGISLVLEEKLKPVGTYAHSQAYGGIRAVAELLNRMQRPRSRAVLEKIDADKPEVANSIRQLMFVFDDIATLDDAAIREILQRVDKKTIAAALKGATEAQSSQFYRNMSSRAVDMMKEEIEIMGPIKIKDVHAAQQRIVETVRKLEEEGVLTLSGGGGGDEYVV
ncbi:MAG: flagellar motor switch protein FliG [Acidobacteria bacterium]|nr:MAG: flagellar motor switch protein FliG [Acidobacteriota bacterium]